jgi:hypothetical protein
LATLTTLSAGPFIGRTWLAWPPQPTWTCLSAHKSGLDSPASYSRVAGQRQVDGHAPALAEQVDHGPAQIAARAHAAAEQHRAARAAGAEVLAGPDRVRAEAFGLASHGLLPRIAATAGQ